MADKKKFPVTNIGTVTLLMIFIVLSGTAASVSNWLIRLQIIMPPAAGRKTYWLRWMLRFPKHAAREPRGRRITLRFPKGLPGLPEQN